MPKIKVTGKSKKKKGYVSSVGGTGIPGNKKKKSSKKKY